MMVMADGLRRWYDRRESAADPGASVTLTIDETIQYIAEKELAAAISETHAKAGTVVVQDPNTGELLAVANWPTFDPNDAGSYPGAGAHGPRGDSRLRAGIDVQGDHADGRDRERRGESE